MKCSIEGFNQEYAATLKKEITVGGKTKTIRIDCTDLVILRWFVDFYPRMKKMYFDGREFAWVSHKKLAEDLPILDINRKSCIERMQKLVEFGILDYRLVKDNGTFSLYTFSENYNALVCSSGQSVSDQTDTGVYVQTDTGCTVERTRGVCSNGHGVYVQTDTKDSNTINKSIRDRNIDDNIPPYPPRNEYDAEDTNRLKRVHKPDQKQAELFERFWREYPKKVSKGQALKTWEKLNPGEDLTEKMIQAIEIMKKRDHRFRDERYTPNPSTWLNGYEWENVYTTNEIDYDAPDAGVWPEREDE